jgi:hypothetical protein
LSGINASIGDALRTDRAHSCDGAVVVWFSRLIEGRRSCRRQVTR